MEYFADSNICQEVVIVWKSLVSKLWNLLHELQVFGFFIHFRTIYKR
jgi:hypothetical protein